MTQLTGEHFMKSKNDMSDVADNLKNWNDRAVVHANGGYGDLTQFAKNQMLSLQLLNVIWTYSNHF